MTFTHRILRLAVAGAFALSGVVSGGAAVMAQGSPTPDFEPDYFESMLTGYEIEISGSEFVIDDVVQQNYTDGENEQVYIESDYASVQVTLLDDSDAPEDTIELWISNLSEGLDTLEIVDSGLDDEVTWYYAEGEYEDVGFVYYVQVEEDVDGNVDLLESVLTVEGNLVDAVDAAQQDITVDGDEFMDDVDLDELEALAEGGSFRDGGTVGDDDADDADDDTSRDRSRDQEPDEDDDDSGSDRSRDRDPDDTADDEEDDSSRDRSRDRDDDTSDDDVDDTGN